jgi:hypothetical protein
VVGKRVGGRDSESCSGNFTFDYLKLVFVVIRKFLWKLAVWEGG